MKSLFQIGLFVIISLFAVQLSYSQSATVELKKDLVSVQNGEYYLKEVKKFKKDGQELYVVVEATCPSNIMSRDYFLKVFYFTARMFYDGVQDEVKALLEPVLPIGSFKGEANLTLKVEMNSKGFNARNIILGQGDTETPLYFDWEDVLKEI